MKRRKGVQRELDAIRAVRSNFVRRGFSTSVSWLDFLYTNIKEGNPSDYLQDWRDLVNAYENDIKRFGEFPLKIYKQINHIFAYIINEDINKFSALLEEAHPFFVDWRKTQENLIKISQITKEDIPSMEPTARYYLFCFTYLIAIEGSYENWIKILYYLLYNFRSGEINFNRVQKKSLRSIKRWMINHDVDNILFEAYENGHLRNAIAHAHFEYDEITKKMLFIDYYRGEETYKKELNLREFEDNLQTVFLIPDICTNMIMLLRILDVVRKLYL